MNADIYEEYGEPTNKFTLFSEIFAIIYKKQPINDRCIDNNKRSYAETIRIFRALFIELEHKLNSALLIKINIERLRLTKLQTKKFGAIIADILYYDNEYEF